MASSELDNVAQVLNLARRNGFVRSSDLDALRVERIYLKRLVEKGLLLRTGRGLYALPDAAFSEWHSLALTAKLVPGSTICLLSALRFHSIGTQDPHEVWIAIGRRAAMPRLEYPKVRVMRPSGATLETGIETHHIENVPVQIYNPAKTVVDCFKYRNKIGIDVALEALREGLRARKFTREEIWDFARLCRVGSVIRPYMEAIG